MKCEYCKRDIVHLETAHGIKHGVIRSYPEGFQPARDSAWTVICSSCGEMLCRLIYAKLGKITQMPSHSNA